MNVRTNKKRLWAVLTAVMMIVTALAFSGCSMFGGGGDDGADYKIKYNELKKEHDRLQERYDQLEAAGAGSGVPVLPEDPGPEEPEGPDISAEIISAVNLAIADTLNFLYREPNVNLGQINKTTIAVNSTNSAWYNFQLKDAAALPNLKTGMYVYCLNSVNGSTAGSGRILAIDYGTGIITAGFQPSSTTDAFIRAYTELPYHSMQVSAALKSAVTGRLVELGVELGLINSINSRVESALNTLYRDTSVNLCQVDGWSIFINPGNSAWRDVQIVNMVALPDLSVGMWVAVSTGSGGYLNKQAVKIMSIDPATGYITLSGNIVTTSANFIGAALAFPWDVSYIIEVLQAAVSALGVGYAEAA